MFITSVDLTGTLEN